MGVVRLLSSYMSDFIKGFTFGSLVVVVADAVYGIIEGSFDYFKTFSMILAYLGVLLILLLFKLYISKKLIKEEVEK